MLASALFIHGVGLSAIGVPSISAAYASVIATGLADGDNRSQFEVHS